MSLGVALFPQENDKQGQEAQAGHGRNEGNGHQGRVVVLSAAFYFIRIL